MRYLILYDVYRVINQQTLAQLARNTGGEDLAYLLTNIEAESIEYLKSKISKKYDLNAEFNSPIEAYNISRTNPYSAGERLLFESAPGVTPHTFDIYCCLYPAPIFSSTNQYKKGEIVFYENHTYTATNDLNITDNNIQSFEVSSYMNYLQNPKLDTNNWTDNGVYSVPATTIPNTSPFFANELDFTKQKLNFGARNQQMVRMVALSLVLRLYQRVNFASIPTTIREAYNQEVIDVINSVNSGVSSFYNFRIKENQQNLIKTIYHAKAQRKYTE